MALLGYTKSCGPRSGGITTLYLASKNDVESFTLSSGDNFYDTVTMETGTQFHKYEFDADTCGLTIPIARENKSKSYTPTLEFDLGKLSKGTRDAVEELVDASDCGLIAIVKDTSGQHWVLGYSELHGKDRPLEASGGEINTGKAINEANYARLSLSATSAEAPRAFDGTVPVTPAA